MEPIFIYVMIYFGLFFAIFYLIEFIENKEKINEKKTLTRYAKVSIIVPAYNEEKTIVKTLKSLIKLDYPKDKFEIIVVNDGSTDKTKEKVESFIKKHRGYDIKLFNKKNGGKGSALNYGIKRAKGEFIATLDADSFVSKDALKKMMCYFDDAKVMAVTPAMTVHNPRNFYERLVHAEYLFGIFLRKAFAFLNAIHVTPGPFSIFRKKFFDKYGGFDENNLTEDIEIGLRIQSKGYKIENCMDARVETVTPKTFKDLLKQRRRWYRGFIDNSIKYKHLFTPRYGYFGLIMLPSAFVSVAFCLGYVIYFIFKNMEMFSDTITRFRVLGLSVFSLKNFDIAAVKEALFNFFFHPLIPLTLLSIILMVSMIVIAKKLSREKYSLKLSLLYFFIAYWFMYAFWWGIAIMYKVLNRSVSWK